MVEWEDELERWLKPFLDRLGHKTRERMCPLYVAGLIGPGDRKSVQPMAERLATGNYDQLHHFIADGVWDAAPLESELLNQADRLVGGKDAVLVIDDTAMPKKGERSVGVAAQYASALGKTANCQTLVSLTRADDHDRLRLLATSSPHTSGAEKKESTDRRLSLACRPYATLSSISFFDRYPSNAYTAGDEAGKNSGVSKSAKVVLVRSFRQRARPARPKLSAA